jgi:cold shock CspA family protein
MVAGARWAPAFSFNSKTEKQMYGKIKHWNEEKHYGFLTEDDAGGDLFFHGSAMTGADVDPPQIGELVRFDMGMGKNGKCCAINVARAEPA